MAGLTRENFHSPDETRPFEEGKGRLEVINTDGGVVGRARFEPGWQRSEHVKPIASGLSGDRRPVLLQPSGSRPARRRAERRAPISGTFLTIDRFYIVAQAATARGFRFSRWHCGTRPEPWAPMPAVAPGAP